MLSVEYSKQVLRMRTLLAWGLTILIPTIIVLALEFSARPRRLQNASLFSLAKQSGLNVPLASLNSMSTFLLPLVVLIFTASSVSEEAGWGSLRYLLIRPVARSHLLVAKLVVAVSLSLVAAALLTLTASLEGVIAFGWHPVITVSLNTVTQATALARIIVSTGYVFWSLCGVMAFGFMLSIITDSTLGAVGGGLGLVIISDILNVIEPLGVIRTFLPTYHLHAWEELFARSVSTTDMLHGVLLQIPYILVCLAIAWWRFNQKDILT